MSTELKYDAEVVDALLSFSRGMIAGEPGRPLIEALRARVEHISPHDLLRMEDLQLRASVSTRDIKRSIGKILNVLYAYLDAWQWERPDEHSFLGVLMAENAAMLDRLQGIKSALRRMKEGEGTAWTALRDELLDRFTALRLFDAHYVKKENLLFPLLERSWESYRSLKVMWSLHDDIRRSLETVIALLARDDVSKDEVNRPLGDYFFLAIGMIHKEERIVFPAAMDTVPPAAWADLHRQSFDFPFAFIARPDEPAPPKAVDVTPDAMSGLVRTPTGTLDVEQLILMLDALPVDVTFVDQEDKVAYFSRGRERIFPRSPAIIGRDVRNCHPPESVAIVEQIIEALRGGEKDSARFWLELGGRFIVIDYYALRAGDGEYRGVLEVSQDITALRALKGERRLLDW